MPHSKVALPLLPGDPVPELLTSPPLDLGAYAGRWALLLSCDAADLPMAETVSGALPDVDLLVIVRDMAAPGGYGVEAFGDPHAHAANALGAVAIGGVRARVATLLDPRGTVQLAVVASGAAQLVDAVQSCRGGR